MGQNSSAEWGGKPEHVLRKIHHCTFGRKISERPFLEFYSYFLHNIHPLYTHPHAVFTFLHLALCSRNSSYCIHHLFRLNSSLHKQPFITAHFRSSLHILCINAH